MVNKMKKKRLLKADMSIEEASNFWDKHSVADYASKEITMHYSPKEEVTLVAISKTLLPFVRKESKKHNVSAEILINQWIKEKVVNE